MIAPLLLTQVAATTRLLFNRAVLLLFSSMRSGSQEQAVYLAVLVPTTL